MDEVSICNLALGNVGISTTIASLDENSHEARTCNRYYAHARDSVLRKFPFNFSTRYRVLATLAGTVPPGWAYMYSYPTDCLQARAVTDEAGLRAFITSTSSAALSNQIRLLNRRYPFQVQANDELTSRIIVTDLSEAYLIYTARVTVTNMFDPLALTAIAWELASLIAMPLSVKPDLADRAIKMAAFTLGQAAAQSLNEAGDDEYPDSPSIAVRQ